VQYVIQIEGITQPDKQADKADDEQKIPYRTRDSFHRFPRNQFLISYLNSNHTPQKRKIGVQ
jgi:hypothetical protein